MFNHLIFNLPISATTEVFGICLILHGDSCISIFRSSDDLLQQRKEGEMKKGEREGEVHLQKGLPLLTVVLLQWMIAARLDKEETLV